MTETQGQGGENQHGHSALTSCCVEGGDHKWYFEDMMLCQSLHIIVNIYTYLYLLVIGVRTGFVMEINLKLFRVYFKQIYIVTTYYLSFYPHSC